MGYGGRREWEWGLGYPKISQKWWGGKSESIENGWVGECILNNYPKIKWEIDQFKSSQMLYKYHVVRYDAMSAFGC